MHLSLKGSMDRQPLTDRLGDRLLAEYGGAAAAYSLRALNGNGDSVVRVRRASDNDEKDFTASQVSSGELTNWVNSQTVPPLDIGVETSEGRIPVPEGGASIGTPAAAYSLRNLSTTYTGNVVDVRRSRNNAVASFTAAEVADGTLEAWVTEEQVVWNLQPTWDISVGNGVITSQSSTATTSTFSVTTISGESFVRQSSKPNHIIASSGDRVLANITLSGFDVPVSARLRTAGTNTNVSEQTLSNGTADYTFNLTGSGGYFAFSNIEATSGATLTINSIKVIGRSGFVSKWYDQSGNNNHATQGTPTSQPKIVNVGSLVTGGINFDNVDDYLNLGTAFNISTDFAVFGTLYSSNFSIGGRLFHADGNNNVRVRNATYDFRYRSNGVNYDFGIGNSFTNNNQSLFSFLNSGDEHSLFVDGSLKGQNTITDNFLMSAISDPSTGITLGGAVSEIIIYTSDQSANRTAIEANIGETYGITGIPAYDNTVDGFVETWYDQSGNGNDATQSVAVSQPKIVDGGTLATKLGQPSINFTTDSAVLLSDSFSITETESAVFAIWQPAKDSATTVQARHRTLFGNVSSEIYIGTPNADSQMSFKRFDAVKTFTLGLASLNTPNLHAFVGTTAGVDYYFNGSSIYSDTATGTNSIRNHLRIGSKQNLATHDTEGYISELIIYDSDQSANRSGIETNINAHYNIYP
jgi:hypothetical protein